MNNNKKKKPRDTCKLPTAWQDFSLGQPRDLKIKE
jgi:hypothetical protein